ncbi:MAG: hypothetical protein ACTHN5_00150 [Phycisphaerae bacterium]
MKARRCILPSPRPPNRGSALILVVAILGLLAVIGTVYIVSARTESASVRAGSEGLNLDLACDAVMNQVRNTLYAATVNGEGQVGIIEPNQDLPRFFDYPEHHDGHARDMPDFPSLPNGRHQLTPDQPWLARNIHRASPADDDLCDLPTLNDHPADGTLKPAINVMNDGGLPDAVAHLLSYTSPGGVRYRFAVRIVDLSRMANLNVGAPQGASGPRSALDPDGEFLTSYALGDGGAIDRSRRYLYAKPFTPEDWQRQLLQCERPEQGIAFFDAADELELRAESGSPPTAAARPVAVWNFLASSAQRFTCCSFSRDLRLRSSPALPVNAVRSARALQASPGKAAASPPVILAPPYTLNPANKAVYPLDCGPNVWPLAPAKAGINPRLDASNPGAALFYLAKAATNVATAMEASGFSPQESRAFAANYLTARWSGITFDGNAYTFSAGPSFIDDQGICIRATNPDGTILKTDTSEFGGPSDLSAILPPLVQAAADENNRIYIGFLPQPFINKVAVDVFVAGGGATAIGGFAVELYNPFPVRLSLNGFVLQTSRTGPPVPLDNYTIDARGFLTLIFRATAGGGTLRSRVSGASVVLNGTTLDANDGQVILCRPYIPREHEAPDALAEIDAYPYDAVCGKNTPAAPGLYLLQRLNEPAGNSAAAWESAIACDGATVPHLENGGNPVLGVPNTAAAVTDSEKRITPIDLGDRYTEEAAPEGKTVAGPIESLRNLNDFNRIPRICNIIQNPAIAPSSPAGDQTRPLSRQLGDLFAAASPPYTAKTDFPYDAQVHFDFKATPDFFTDPTRQPQASDQFPCDARAVRLFDYLCMLDRVGDPSVDIGGGANDVMKLRLPGQINVNTADLPTLSAIANMPPAVAAKIVAYRDRAYGSYPGRGIRTLGELLVPVCDALAGSPKNLRERDDAWARIVNQCTTRSDTFAAYGYLEAIRPNPNLAVHSPDDFYDVASTSSDPHDPAAKNIRVAARRWLAIVDRSWCNAARGESAFELPRVLAMRDR